jgi:NADPH:quinone reductase-like Zn-dependent oxidoreductase
MKAVRLLEYGGQLVFNDLPTPAIARDEILVKIRSTAVNHLDLVKASGTARQILPIELPWVPGHEFSGVVEQIGGDVEAYAQGDAVFAANETGGAYAEYLAVKATAIARKPSNLSFEEAASVPVASQTAWQGLFTRGHLEKGQTILIHGGAGAVGAYAVQLASHAGAIVIATASGDDEVYLKSIGASRVINYREAQFEKVLREKVDVVFDLVGGDAQKRSFLVLKEGGHLVSAVQPVSQEEAAMHHVTGTHKGPQELFDVFAAIQRYWKTLDFKVTDSIEQGSRVAFFGSFTYKSNVTGKEITSPFSLLARFEGDKVAYVQFLEDSYGTAGSFKTGGTTRFHSDPSGKEVEI